MDKEATVAAQVPLGEAIHEEDPDDEWQTAVNTGRSFRVRVVTGSLVVLLVLAGGFWGGVVAEKHHGNGSTTSALASRLAALRAGGTGRTGTGGRGGTGGFAGAGGSGSATTGTVIDVQGNIVDISDSSGNIVKVAIGPSTTVTRTARSNASGIQIGDTVVVSGSAGAGGTVNATTVRAVAQGVTAGGGLGGGRPTGAGG